jgi:hypothetical protein
MKDDESNVDDWIRHLVSRAGSDAPDASEVPVAPGPTRRARRRSVAVAASVVVLAGVGGIVWSFVASDPPRPSPAVSDPLPTSPPTSPALPDTTSSPTTTSATSPSATVNTQPIAPELTRPIVDLDDCRTVSADQRQLTVDGAYVWARQEGLAVQLYVLAGGSVDATFAVAVRSSDTPRFDPASANTDVGGLPARRTFATPTRGEILWQLPDGTEAYVRTSTMGEDELLDLARSLVPRPVTATIPAFDANVADYELVDEAVTPYVIDEIVDSTCELPDGAWIRATIVDARPIAQALFLTDRPDGPTSSRLLPDGRLLTVSARPDVRLDVVEAALDSIREATDAEWTALSLAGQ